MPLDRLLSTSDVVSLHCPLTPETRHLIDQPALARMKRTAYLINASRGPVVDEAALAWALKNRLIAGAGLDVYEDEPRVHPDLLGLENVVLVPHLGSATTETRTAMADLAAQNVVAVADRPAAADARGHDRMPISGKRLADRLVGRTMRDAGAGDHGHGAAGRREDLREPAGGPVPDPDRDAAFGAHAGRDHARGVDAPLRPGPHAAHDGQAAGAGRSSG